MPKTITPSRKPLFGGGTTPTKPVSQPANPMGQLPTSMDVTGEKKSLFSKKLVVSLGVLAVSLIVIVIIFLVGGSYTKEVIEKSGLFIPLIRINKIIS